jgi:hypothetical protein
LVCDRVAGKSGTFLFVEQQRDPMTTNPCDACSEAVRIAGGIGDFWSASGGSTGGVELELADGTEHFLCLSCLDRLPEDETVTAADVEALRRK